MTYDKSKVKDVICISCHKPIGDAEYAWFTCPYQFCGSREISALFYTYQPGCHVTYECYCRACRRKWVKSISLGR